MNSFENIQSWECKHLKYRNEGYYKPGRSVISVMREISFKNLITLDLVSTNLFSIEVFNKLRAPIL